MSVSPESCIAAAHRIVTEHGHGGGAVLALNFASAKHIGGGWLSGAVAQEETLARASALSACLEAAPDYYKTNKRATQAAVVPGRAEPPYRWRQ